MDLPRVIVGLGIVATASAIVTASAPLAAVVGLVGIYALGTGIKE